MAKPIRSASAIAGRPNVGLNTFEKREFERMDSLINILVSSNEYILWSSDSNSIENSLLIVSIIIWE